jgi:paraquat-inducible protein B
MSKQPNKTLIGAFLVGAVVLVVAGVLIFGGGKLFTKVTNYVLYFDGSVKGLNIGAPVIFRGVKIGSVTDVKVRLEGKDLGNLRVPVLIEIESDRISLSGADPELLNFVTKEISKRTGKTMELLITKHGLRAQLVSQSLVTGQLAVSFDFHPDKTIKLVGGDTEHMEIPTIPSTMEALTDTIKELPLEELVDRILKLVENADNVVNSPDLKGSISALHETLQNANKLVQNVDGEVGPLLSSVEKTSGAAQAALKQAQKSLALTENVLAEDSPALNELTNALRDISAAARSLSALTDYLQRHPESLLRGKGGPGGK